MNLCDSDGMKTDAFPFAFREPCFHALRIVNPLYDSQPRATFHGSTDEAWLLWSKNIFRKILYPALQKGLRFAASEHAQELIDLDIQISQLLLEPYRSASLASGRYLLLFQTVPRGERVLKKLVQRSHTEGGCHLALAYAARCATFHLSPALCTTSYLYQEAWTGFHPRVNSALLTEYVTTALCEGKREERFLNLQVA